MISNIHEVLEENSRLETKDAKIAHLQENETPTLLNILKLGFDKSFEFFVTEIPSGYKPNSSPIGMGYMSLHSEWKQLRYFIKNHPDAINLKSKRLHDMFLQFLEGLEAKEAEVVLHVIRHDLSAYGLRKSVAKEAFPKLGL